ncbi:MAG: ROK family protein [Cellulomonadaceae bacterium]
MEESDPRAERSRRAVVDTLSGGQPLTRAEIHERTGLALSTISAVVATLKDQGRLSEETVDAGVGRRGRPATRLVLVEPFGIVVGASVAHDTVDVLVATSGGQELARRRVDIADRATAGEVMDLTAATCRDLLDETGHTVGEVLEVAVAVPAPVDPVSGSVPADITVVSTWRSTEPARLLADRLGRPVSAVNDANASALAECRSGAASGASDMLYIECTRGLGGAVIIDGLIHAGSDGRVGEVGHVKVPGGAELCVCGQRGCLESEVSTVAMAAKLRAIGLTSATAAGIAEVLTVEQGNTAVARLLYEAGFSLGAVLSSMCNLLAPERVVLGGELAAGGEPLRSGVVESISRYSLAAVARRLDVRLSMLGEAGAVLGAVALASGQVNAGRSRIAYRALPSAQAVAG